MAFSETSTGKIIKKFCESTSLHGYSYLYIASTIFMRVAWVCVIIGMTGLGTYFLAKNTKEYINAKLVTNIDSSIANLSVSMNKLITIIEFLEIDIAPRVNE